MTPADQLADLERELASLREQIAAAEATALERHQATRKLYVLGDAADLLPLRDRIQVLERKIARLKARAW